MYPFLIRFLLGVRVRRIYIRAGFLENVTAKIELSPQTVFSFENYLQRSQQNTRSAAVAFFTSPPSFLLALSIFPFLVLFQLRGFSGSFCFRLLVFFSVKRLHFSFGTFSKTQRDNALAFTVTFTIIFVNVPTSSSICFTFFEAFLFLLVRSELEGRRGQFY